MRRTWVEDSRERQKRRRVSLNTLGLEQLEDRLTLSHSPAPVPFDTALSLALSTSETRPVAFPQAMFTSATQSTVQRLSLTDNTRFEFMPIAPIDVSLLPVNAPLPSTGPLTGINIVESPIAKLPSYEWASPNKGLIVSEHTADVRISNQPWLPSYAEVGTAFRLDALNAVSLNAFGPAANFIISGTDLVTVHTDRFDVFTPHGMNVVSHLGDLEQHTGAVAAHDVAFEAVFNAREAWLNDVRTDGSARLDSMTNFAAGTTAAQPVADASASMASVAAWAATGPAPLRTASLDANATMSDALFDSQKQAADAATLAGKPDRSGSFAGRASWSAMRLWHELPVLASMAAESFASEMSDPVAGVQTALLDTLALNTAALDDALDNVVGEVERLGAEIVTWFDRMRVPPWAATTVVVAAIGGGSLLARRWRAQQSIDAIAGEDSSTWLFTRLQSTLG